MSVFEQSPSHFPLDFFKYLAEKQACLKMTLGRFLQEHYEELTVLVPLF